MRPFFGAGVAAYCNVLFGVNFTRVGVFSVLEEILCDVVELENLRRCTEPFSNEMKSLHHIQLYLCWMTVFTFPSPVTLIPYGGTLTRARYTERFT